MFLGIPIIEWVGYIASACIVLSLVMTSIEKIRIINTIGCLLYVYYGIRVGAYPVAVANVCIVLINAYHLIKLKKQSS